MGVALSKDSYTCGDIAVLSKLLRLGEGRMVKRLKKVADYVGTLSDDVEKLTDAELRAKTDEFKRRLADQKNPETLAQCEAAVRIDTNQPHLDQADQQASSRRFGQPQPLAEID